MSKYRLATLLASESNATAGTKTIDIDLKDPISKLTVINKVTSAGTVLTAHPAGDITKIEVVDGSEVIASLSGYECQGLDFYNTKKSPDNYLCDVSGVMSLATFNINFGRWLWDNDLAFDPSKFNNPQLKITHNYQVADASASASTLEVYAQVFDEKKISPAGYLRATETDSISNSANGSVDTIDLPTDLPIRQIMIRAALADYYPYQVVNKVKIKENGGAKVPFDFSVSAWLKIVENDYGRCNEPAAIAVNQTARDVYCLPTFTVGVYLMPSTVTNIISREVTHTTIPFALDITASDTAMGEFFGFCPHYCFPIPFGDQEDITDWLSMGERSSLKMDLTAGSAGTNGTTQVVLEQFKRY